MIWAYVNMETSRQFLQESAQLDIFFFLNIYLYHFWRLQQGERQVQIPFS